MTTGDRLSPNHCPICGWQMTGWLCGHCYGGAIPPKRKCKPHRDRKIKPPPLTAQDIARILGIGLLQETCYDLRYGEHRRQV